MSLDVSLLNCSLAHATQQGDEFAETFFRQLFGRHRELRALFAGVDMPELHEKFVTMLRTIVASLEQPESLATRLADLGADHVAFGARPDDYKVFGESLMATLQLRLGNEWMPETEHAWRELYRMIAERMLEGATATVR